MTNVQKTAVCKCYKKAIRAANGTESNVCDSRGMTRKLCMIEKPRVLDLVCMCIANPVHFQEILISTIREATPS